MSFRRYVFVAWVSRFLTDEGQWLLQEDFTTLIVCYPTWAHIYLGRQCLEAFSPKETSSCLFPKYNILMRLSMENIQLTHTDTVQYFFWKTVMHVNT